MALQSRTRTLRLTPRIDMKHLARNVLPICSICVSIEETQIRHEMLLIVACQKLNGWSQIRTSGIERRTPHDICLCSKTPQHQGSHGTMATSFNGNEVLVILLVGKYRLKRERPALPRAISSNWTRVAAPHTGHKILSKISAVSARGQGRCVALRFHWLLH